MTHEKRGPYAIAMLHPSHPENVGGVARATGCFDADYLATIGHKYEGHASAVGHDRHTPIWHFLRFKDLLVSLPYKTELVAIDFNEDATRLRDFKHPERALYVLGEEGPGFQNHPEVLERVEHIVYIPAEYCMNVAVAGNMVLEDRYSQADTDS